MRRNPRPGSKIHFLNINSHPSEEYPYFKTYCGIIVGGGKGNEIWVQPTAKRAPYINCQHCKPWALKEVELLWDLYEFSHSPQAQQVYKTMLEHYRE